MNKYYILDRIAEIIFYLSILTFTSSIVLWIFDINLITSYPQFESKLCGTSIIACITSILLGVYCDDRKNQY